ncbi:MAG: Yip1 family protein [Candidatus Micrarchaeota archaeon]|nr:Yip1 family protein [Candidatus Micrarchaeota archaeon]
MAKGKESSGSGVLAPVENVVMPIVSAIPLAQVKTWASAFFHPVDAYNSNSKMDWGTIAVSLVLIGLVMWVASLVQMILGINFLGFGVALFAVIGYAIFVPIMAIIGSLVYFVLAKIFGGKGSFKDQTVALTLVMGGIAVIGFPFTALSSIMLVGAIFGLIYMAISLYGMYNMYLSIKAVHSLSSMKAAAVVLIPIVIVFIVMFVMAAALTVSNNNITAAAMGGIGTTVGLMAAAGMGGAFAPRPY